MTEYRTFRQASNNLKARFKMYGKEVHTERWQGTDISKRPDMVTHELLNETFTVNTYGIEDLSHWQLDCEPNLPWADAHFLERVCGMPLNPGVEWANWPWAQSADKHRKQEMFNHTYMERLWPRYAGNIGATKTAELARDRLNTEVHHRGLLPHLGIRGEYGDLSTLIDKLAHEPLTRQAYIPLYFPEDTGMVGRMPCTLGYQFIMRDNALHMYYPLRSCDFVRHWSDDCYLGVRLLLWVLDECRKCNELDWKNVLPGTFTMHATSLHIFANDWIKLKEGKL